MWVLLENVEKRCQNMCRLLVQLLKYGACSVTDQALFEICHNAQAMDFPPRSALGFLAIQEYDGVKSPYRQINLSPLRILPFIKQGLQQSSKLLTTGGRPCALPVGGGPFVRNFDVCYKRIYNCICSAGKESQLWLRIRNA